MSVESTFVYRDNPGLIETLAVYINPTKVSLNYMTLHINQRIQKTTPVTSVAGLVNEYVHNVLQDVEVKVKTHTVGQYSLETTRGLGNIGDTYVDRLVIPNPGEVRKVVNRLWQRNELSADNRTDIEIALNKLKNNVKYAKKINDDVEPTVTQKKIIEELVSPYIEKIQEEMPNIEFAKSCIRSAAHHVKRIGSFQNLTTEIMRFHLPSCYRGKSASFYDCLFAVARILTSMAGLEDTLSKNGDTLPSERQIADIVLKTVDKIYSIEQ